MQRDRISVRAFGLAGASFLCLYGTALAGQAGTATASAPSDAESVLITGFLEQDLPRRLAELGTSVYDVSAAQIQNAGYVDVSQALQVTVPGLSVVPLAGPFDYVDVSFQGSRTQDVLWTVDGVRINNRLYGGTTPLDTLPASMIERIEVLSGPQSLFYGTSAMAGAINFVTKDFSDKADGRLNAGGDTNGGKHFDGYFRDTLDGHHFVIFGSVDQADGRRPFREEDFQPSGTDHDRGYEVYTVGGKYAYDFNNDFRLTLSETHTDAKLDFALPQGAAKAFNERQEDILSAKIDYTPQNSLQFFVKGYYHWWYAWYTEVDNDLDANGNLTGTQTVVDDHEFWGFKDYGLNAMGKFMPTRGVETYLGYDYQNYSGNDVVLVIEKKTEHVHAIFGEIATTRDLIPNVQFAAGFRYNAPSVGQDATVWNLTGRWDVNEQLYVKGMVGTAFRLPTAEELFANDPNDERGNPNLKPEESINVNGSLGGSFMSGMFRWEAIGFYREIENLIDLDTFDDTTNQDVFGNVLGKVNVHGGVFSLDAALTPDLSTNLSYTVSSSKNSITDLQINRVPESLFKATIDYHPMSLPFGLFASMNYVGETFDTPGGVRTKYGDYVTVDLGGRAFLDMDRHHRIDLGIHNVFDETYTTRFTRGFPDDGGPAYLISRLGQPRTFYASYGYSFF